MFMGISGQGLMRIVSVHQLFHGVGQGKGVRVAGSVSTVQECRSPGI